MRGLDWSALPTIVEMLGVTDIESFVVRLTALRDWQAENKDE